MNTEKINTLNQVLDAMEIVENARAILGLTSNERLELEKASLALRNLERSIIREKTDKLIDSLTTDANSLKELVNKMKESTERLGGVASGIEKAVKVVESLINIVATSITAGLI